MKQLQRVGTARAMYLHFGSVAFNYGSGIHIYGSQIQAGWQHVAITYNGTSFVAYLNGTQLGVNQIASLSPVSAPLEVGVYIDLFSGSIDEVRIYNRTLTQPEILSDMNTPIGSVTVPLEGGVSNDGVVNIQDILLITNDFSRTSGFNPAVDGAAPFGQIDIFDVMVVIRNWGRTR